MIVTNVNEIELGYTQAFKYTPLSFGSYSSNKILELVKNGAITKAEVDIARYLFKFKCAPLAYIERDVPGLDEKNLSRKMDDLVRNRIFNSFILVSAGETFDNASGLVFYTLDYGAILLLRNLIEDENLDNWKATDLFMTGIKVKKALMVIDFYRNLKEVEYYNPYVVYASYGAKIKTKATFKQGDKTYLMEIVCADDMLEGSPTEITEKILHYDQLLGTDGWSYYFEERPVLLIVADSNKARDNMKKRLEGCKIPEIQYAVMEIKPI